MMLFWAAVLLLLLLLPLPPPSCSSSSSSSSSASFTATRMHRTALWPTNLHALPSVHSLESNTPPQAEAFFLVASAHEMICNKL